MTRKPKSVPAIGRKRPAEKKSVKVAQPKKAVAASLKEDRKVAVPPKKSAEVHAKPADKGRMPRPTRRAARRMLARGSLWELSAACP